MYLRRLGNVDVHLHVDALALHVNNLRWYRIVEVHKGYDVGELVIDSKRRVGEDAADIRAAQHIELSAHLQVGERAPKSAAKVDEDLAVGQRALPLRSIDELIVVGSHIHVELHSVEVAEVDIAVEHKRRLACSICLDAVKVDTTVLDGNRMVWYLQVHVVAVCIDMQ